MSTETLTIDPRALSSADVCAVLKPLFDLGDIRDLNGPAGQRLAQLIAPRSALDLTVREVLAHLAQAEDFARFILGGAA